MTNDPVTLARMAQMKTAYSFLSELFKGYGFALLVFPLDQNSDREDFTSNCERADSIGAMQAFIEGQKTRSPSSDD
jgi:hypothetical protein